MIGIAMAVADLADAGSRATEVHAGVIEPIGENKRLGAQDLDIEEGLEHRRIGLKSRGHDERRLRPLQAGDFFLDTGKNVEVAGDQTRRARSGAEIARPFAGALDHCWMPAQPQIIVAGEIDIGPTCDHNPRARIGVHRPQLAAQPLGIARLQKGIISAFSRHHDPVLPERRSGSKCRK